MRKQSFSRFHYEEIAYTVQELVKVTVEEKIPFRSRMPNITEGNNLLNILITCAYHEFYQQDDTQL